jgi:hypothetical protein
MPQSLGGIYGHMGESLPIVQLLSPAGVLTDISASSAHSLVVVAPDGSVSEFEVAYNQGPGDVGSVYDLPEIPELDGLPTPELLLSIPGGCP